MPDEVVIEAADESPDDQPSADAPTTPSADETTWKKRLAGKDQALTATKKESEALKAQLAEAQRRNAEYENASLTELERLQKDLEKERTRASAAEAKALRVDLERKFPLTFDLLGDKTPLDDESWLAEREARLSKDDESDAPGVDPNNPRRTSPKTTKPTGDELVENLRKMGNPFKTAGWGGG